MLLIESIAGLGSAAAWPVGDPSAEIPRHVAELAALRRMSLWPNISTVTPLLQVTRIYRAGTSGRVVMYDHAP
jgi:hypothetical protein